MYFHRPLFILVLLASASACVASDDQADPGEGTDAVFGPPVYAPPIRQWDGVARTAPVGPATLVVHKLAVNSTALEVFLIDVAGKVVVDHLEVPRAKLGSMIDAMVASNEGLNLAGAVVRPQPVPDPNPPGTDISLLVRNEAVTAGWGASWAREYAVAGFDLLQ
jgi:hypothetical protein